jgi:ATP-dependent DNA helicase RecG
MKHQESQNVEFKRTWRDEHLRIITAFANANDGNLIIGGDDGGTVNIKNLDYNTIV